MSLEGVDYTPEPYDLHVLVPSRGRPAAARELMETIARTMRGRTRLTFIVNDDDPTVDEYGKLTSVFWEKPKLVVDVCLAKASSMVEALNQVAITVCDPSNQQLFPERYPAPFAVAFMGDDHRPRTEGWDARYVEVLKQGKSIVYGDDLFQGRRLPTQCAMTSELVALMGYMAPPALKHMYVDNAWLTIGQATNCIAYVPDVIVEHVHPAAGKAEVDEGYARVNNDQVFSDDERAFAQWLRMDFRGIVNRIVMKQQQARVDEQLAVPEIHRVHEWRLFEEGTTPEYTTPEWYQGREHAPHLEQGGGHRERLLNTASLLAQAAFTIKKNKVVDLGSGDGGLLSLLGRALIGWGYDLMPENVEAAKERGVDVRYGDVINGDIEWGDIAVCTEMLEHLIDPHGFVKRIAEHCEALVCSSPADETGDHHYEYHTWAWDIDGYRRLVEQGGFKVIRQRQVSRFQVLLAVRR